MHGGHMQWYMGHIDGFAQDCSNSIASALELLQSCTNASIYYTFYLIESDWRIYAPVYWIFIGVGNGWALVRHQATNWINVDLFSIKTIETIVSNFTIKTKIFIQENTFENVVLNMAAI